MPKDLSFTMKPIGYLESCFKERFGTPRQPNVAPTSTAKLKVLPHFQPEYSLEGLEGFSHVWLLGVFHDNTNEAWQPKVQPPRLEGLKMGVFGTRTPHRPNPLSLSLVRLEKIEKDTLYFSGIDLIEGTPILDIKPYLTSHDFAPDAHVGWVGEKAHGTREIVFETKALDDLHEAMQTHRDLTFESVKRLIEDIVANDPRPLRARQGQSHDHRKDEIFGFYIYDLNVLFSGFDPIRVIGIEQRHGTDLRSK